MSWDRGNIYYNPEKFGCQTVASIDYAGSYEFSMILVLADLENKTFLWATDSGCSCPTPFEEVMDKNELTILNRETWSAFCNAATEKAQYNYVSYSDTEKPDASLFLNDVARKIREWRWDYGTPIVANPFNSESEETQ